MNTNKIIAAVVSAGLLFLTVWGISKAWKKGQN